MAPSFAVGAVFKNEAHALVEWVEHYLGHGADHLVLVDDGSTDDFRARLAPYVERGAVTLLSNDARDDAKGRQARVAERMLRPLCARWEWFAVLDLDEFLYCPGALDTRERLAEVGANVDQVLVDWVHFGSNGHVAQPPSIVAGFTRRAALTTNTPDYYSYKAIVRTRALIAFDVHRHAVQGDTACLSWSALGDGARFLINHYSIQSEAYWRDVKMTRGDVNRWHPTEARDMAWFRAYDRNEEDDLALCHANAAAGITRRANVAWAEALPDDGVTVVVTACNRARLLERTLRSFLAHNTHAIAHFVIVDDSGAGTRMNDFCSALLAPTGAEVTLIYNARNLGQIEAIDVAYAHVRTKHIFHCEEDWEFYRPGFVERSLGILGADPAVVTVWLREHRGGRVRDNGHPVDTSRLLDAPTGGYYRMARDFFCGDFWSGFTFNPGLRRLADYLRLTPFVDACRPYHHAVQPGEIDVARVYRSMGMVGAIPREEEGYVVHIGWGDHVPRHWEGQSAP